MDMVLEDMVQDHMDLDINQNISLNLVNFCIIIIFMKYYNKITILQNNKIFAFLDLNIFINLYFNLVFFSVKTFFISSSILII